MGDLKQELTTNAGNKNVKLEDESHPVTEEQKVVASVGLIGKIKTWFLSQGKFQRVFLLTILFTVILLLLGIVILIFKLDSYLLPSSLSGSIYDKDGKAVQGAVICVAEKCATSEINGSYVVGDLRYGKAGISVNASNFKQKEFDYNVKRGRNDLDVTIEPEGFGSLTGNVDVDLSLYDDLELFLDDEEVEINDDGSFSVSRVAIGDRVLKVESVHFLDEEFEITVDEGQNVLDNLALTPAADVEGKIVDSYTLKPKAAVLVKYADKEARTDEAGSFKLADIELGTKAKLSFFLENYLDKDKSFDLNQGSNIVKDIEITRKGKVVYVSNRMGNKNVYISNYDGSSEKMLSDNKGDSSSPFLTSDGSTVYFISTREAVKDENNSIIPLVYSTSSTGGVINKVSKTSYDDYSGNIGSYNFESMKRTYTEYNYDVDPYSVKLYYGDLDGTNVKKVYSGKNLYIGSTIIANNGDFLLFSVYSSQNPDIKDGLYYLNPENSQARLVWEEGDDYTAYPADISPNRKFALIMVWDGSLGRWDLWNVGIFEDIQYRVTNTSVMEQQPRFTPDGNFITYITSRDNDADVYRTSLDGKGETKVTKDGKVTDYSWNSDGIVFYNSEKVMWAIDSLDNVKAQQVTDSVLGAYYSSYSPYYGM